MSLFFLLDLNSWGLVGIASRQREDRRKDRHSLDRQQTSFPPGSAYLRYLRNEI